MPKLEVSNTQTQTTLGGGGANQLPPTTTPTALPDDDEEVEAAPAQSGEDKTMKIQMYVATLARPALKKAIRSRGGRRPDQQFVTTETDEDLKTELFELLTGKRQPVSAVVPDEVPF